MSKPFPLKWERDEKFYLTEQLEQHDNDEVLYEKVVKLYEEALAEQPDNPEYLYKYSLIFFRKAKKLLRKAAEQYERALKSPQLAAYDWLENKLHGDLIYTRAHLMENHKSIEFYKEKVKEDPTNPRSYTRLITCYQNADQNKEASLIVDTAIKLFPKDSAVHYFLGEVLSRQGKVEEALAAWERSIELDSTIIDGRFSRAFLLKREGRLQEAAEEWRKIILFLNEYEFNTDWPMQELDKLEAEMNKS
jgi:tetratricopeptide (TPR) repeat protein